MRISTSIKLRVKLNKEADEMNTRSLKKFLNEGFKEDLAEHLETLANEWLAQKGFSMKVEVA